LADVAIVTATEVPAESALRGMLAGADFHDAYRCPLNDQALTPVEIFIRAAKRDAAWVSWLMSMRNFIVRQLGLKDVGAMTVADGKPASAYRAGDRLGIFSILSIAENELLLGIDDSHLDVRVSLLKRAGEGDYVVSTVVKIHNWLGRLYMVPVSRIHPLVVKSFMRRAGV
jgi:hypothetical protein